MVCRVVPVFHFIYETFQIEKKKKGFIFKQQWAMQSDGILLN